MSREISEILAKIVELGNALPTEADDYAALPAAKRRSIRLEIEKTVEKLNLATRALDSIRQPKQVFDPASPKVIGQIVAHTLMEQGRERLADTVGNPFYGAGVYAIFYRGKFDCYAPISGIDHPLYVGKADPAELHASTVEQQGTRLHTRLKDHHRSISNAKNLDLADFDCRYLVVRSAWVETAEDLLIDRYKPVWNSEMKVCYGFGKHGDSANTRANERSPWDTLHPGRAWAESEDNTPNKKSVLQIREAIAEHFRVHQPRI